MNIKCYRHPARDAIYECASCGKLICEECMVFDEDDDEVRCPACRLSTAATVAHEEEERGHRAPAAGREGFALGRPSGRLFNRVWLAVFLLLALAAGGIHLFLDIGIPPVTLASEDLGRLENPALEMVVLASALSRYASDHEGKYPEKLEALFPDYIDRKPSVLRTDVTYSYRTDAAAGYILACPQPGKYRFRNLTLRGDGLLEVQ